MLANLTGNSFLRKWYDSVSIALWPKARNCSILSGTGLNCAQLSNNLRDLMSNNLAKFRDTGANLIMTRTVHGESARKVQIQRFKCLERGVKSTYWAGWRDLMSSQSVPLQQPEQQRPDTKNSAVYLSVTKPGFPSRTLCTHLLLLHKHHQLARCKSQTHLSFLQFQGEGHVSFSNNYN